MIPMIQNLGFFILMARNCLRFRSLVIFFTSVLSLFFAIPLAQRYGGIGCAIVTSLAVILGHGVIINIYYIKDTRLDILRFWKEIVRMSFVPFVVTVVGLLILRNFVINSVLSFVFVGTIFTLFFVPLFWFFSMNNYERDLFKKPMVSLYRAIIK